MYCCVPTPTTAVRLVHLTCRVPGRSATNLQGISRCLESGRPEYGFSVFETLAGGQNGLM